MFPQAWQVGLDIQIDCVRAVAAQRRRNGWQLRHWWQQALPQAVLRDGCLQPSEFLIRALRQWRVQLPRHISLRIALPAQRVLQQRMTQPDARLREPERSDYIGGHGLKQFPLDGQTLALDYRAAPADEAALLLTAARRQELQQWLHCLRQAGLHPQAVDITPCALRMMATAAGVPPAAGLMHRLEREWLWVAPADGAFALVWRRATMTRRRCGRCKPRCRWATIGRSMPAACWREPCPPVALAGRRSAPSRSCVRRCLRILRRSRWPVVWRCARRIADVSGQLSALATTPRAAARLFLAGRAAVAGSGAAAGTVLIAGQLRHQQAQRQARLAMLGEDLAALTLLVRQQQQERAQRALHSVRAERQASNAQHNRRYLQLLQQLSSSVPPRCGSRRWTAMRRTACGCVD